MTKEQEIYVCPMHPKVTAKHAGACPVCGMRLVKKSGLIQEHHGEHKSEPKRIKEYVPLIIIILLIFATTAVLTVKDMSVGQFAIANSMRYFMAGFFLVFSGFKLLDVAGFAEGYATYDLLAKRWFLYGYIYPFIELFFGFAYLAGYLPGWLSLMVAVVMGFSGLGVVQKLRKKEKFRCACLGTLLKVPLTTVTIIEDFGMAAMALLMLYLR
jgi:hypothetical protein